MDKGRWSRVSTWLQDEHTCEVNRLNEDEERANRECGDPYGPLPHTCGDCTHADLVTREDACAVLQALRRVAKVEDKHAARVALENGLVVCRLNGFMGHVLLADEGDGCEDWEVSG